MSKKSEFSVRVAGLELISMPDVASALGVTPKHIRTLEKKGDFPPRIVIGPRKIAYRRADLEAWIDARSQRVASGVS